MGNRFGPFSPFDLHDLDRPSTLLHARLHVRLSTLLVRLSTLLVRLSTLLVVNPSRTSAAMYLPILHHLRQPCASLPSITLHVREWKCA
jgi:hypothetical protein